MAAWSGGSKNEIYVQTLCIGIPQGVQRGISERQILEKHLHGRVWVQLLRNEIRNATPLAHTALYAGAHTQFRTVESALATRSV